MTIAVVRITPRVGQEQRQLQKPFSGCLLLQMAANRACGGRRLKSNFQILLRERRPRRERDNTEQRSSTESGSADLRLCVSVPPCESVASVASVISRAALHLYAAA
jgi:hypothetical protein